MELKSVVPWGRSLAEYIEMFSLTESDLKKSILGCGDGPASFNAELTALNGNVVSIDPTYQFDGLSLQSRISEVYAEIMPQMYKNQDKYIWESIASVEELGRTRMDAMQKFISDYEIGKKSGRYIHESLPELSFENNQFDLALCSHYLFLYSDHVSLEEHIASINELCRVAREVRIYPLLSLNGEISPHLKEVLSSLHNSAFITSLVDVKYQFQKGATQMLVVESV
ncbi:MAG: class I SAM-dependent methyltransferase [Leptolyngbyaceae cyanobacterium MO_188.B28]|nr:class I SAM-dependent methyltransferase [Leptolyngbyaceae cyanobacterium MO_188.B28]